MAYQKTTWANGQSPAIDAEHLNKIEQGIADCAQPAFIELFPGSSAGNGGYIDFHYNNDLSDYTSRLIESPKGVIKYNNYNLLSTANIVALYNVSVTFANGVATYSNSAIKSNSIIFVQWRAGAVSTLTDSVLGTTSQNGYVTIVAKTLTGNGVLPVNILIINL